LRRLSFRSRLFAILTLFALAPAALLTLGTGLAAWRTLPGISAGEAWDRVAQTGKGAIDSLRSAPLTEPQRKALDAHEQELESSVTQARRFQFVASRVAPALFVTALVALGILWLAASRVASHLARQLSRPIDELVGWTAMIEQGAMLPPALSRGAPEFEVLRSSMQSMASELEASRGRMREAERAVAFRETARRVAHELKNPLTPIQFAVSQIARSAPPELADAVRVLDEETRRLDRMARSFAQFGRLPEGPVSRIDVGELASTTAQSAIAGEGSIRVTIDPATPEIDGRYDALQRALLNVVLNAIEAGSTPSGVELRVAPSAIDGKPAAMIEVCDEGGGIAPDRLANVWEPYVTDKAGGTGLGLAIARQTILAHHGVTSIESVLGKGTTVRFVLPAASSIQG
jgi:nitrogen fixation/metabolism regulation signal transduction histidine kinase